jgi:hypothetical protein
MTDVIVVLLIVGLSTLTSISVGAFVFAAKR